MIKAPTREIPMKLITFNWPRNLITAWATLALMTVLLSGNLKAQDNASGWKSVATDSAAQRSTSEFVQCTNVWKMSRAGAENPAATMFFDSTITASLVGLEAGVAYELVLTFLSDSGDRAVRVVANGHDLEKRIALPRGKVLCKRWRLPSEVLDTDAELVVEVSRITGPNAVLSSIAILANKVDAKPLVALPPRASGKMVAWETAAQHSFNSFVQCTNIWRTSGMENSVSTNDPLREMFFDNDPIKVVFHGVEPATRYGVELSFLSDCADRSVRISSGGIVLKDLLALPKARVAHKYFSIPPEAIKDGRIEITIAKVSGPNAILSGLAVIRE